MTSTAPLPRRPRPVALARLALVVVLEAGAVLLAVRLGDDPAYRISWSDPEVWLATSPPGATAVAVLRPVALVLAGYLLVATAGYGGAVLLHAPRAVDRLAPMTPGGIRRIAERAVAGCLLTATWAVPAVAHTTAADPPLPPGLRVAATTHPPPAVGPTVTVVAGDHLWGIAERVLARARATSPDALAPHDVAAYWAATIAANRARLRSGDPDLVFPGEVIQLPNPPAS